MYLPMGKLATERMDGTHLKEITTSQYNWLPIPSPDGKYIAYQSLAHSINPSNYVHTHMPSDIWISTMDGKQIWQITDSKMNRDQVVWSPDSQHVAFIEALSSTLVEVDINSKTRHEIVQGASQPRYRPTSTGIAYLSADDGLMWIETNGLTHTLVSTSTLPPLNTIHDFDWLPDGQHVVYTLADKTHQQNSEVPFGIAYDALITSIDRYAPIKIADGIHNLSVSPDGRYISGLTGTGYGDVCVIDWHLAFLLLSPDLMSARMVSAENLAAFPLEEQRSIFTDLYDTTWISDHVARTTLYTCVSDQANYRVTARTYLIDLANKVMVQVGLNK
jgi:Tol biopolymer transport system component